LQFRVFKLKLLSTVNCLIISGADPNTLDYENLDEFEKLRSNPPFPVFNDESEQESLRTKRDAHKNAANQKPNKRKRKNKMDENIREAPDSPDNSKFNGIL
jgi:hypothetical protein